MVQTRIGQVCIYFVPAKADGIFTPQQIMEAGKVAEEGGGFLELILDLPLGVVVREDFAEEATRRLLATGLRLAPRGATVRNVAVCPTCDHGIGNYIEEGVRLDQEIAGLAAPKAMHVSAAGCGCDCAMAHLQDIGYIKRNNGLYDVYIGGSMYGNPQVGELLCCNVPGDKLGEVAKHVIGVYEANRRGKWRLGQVLRRIGIEAFREGLPYSAERHGLDRA
jgi:NAD(P)H-nitrite reductase large subunit